jgi:hypothetical protein
MAGERAIRDWLAKDLSIVEVGLQVVAVEHHLRNAFGSRGFIDILARDYLGLNVIIEIKRSDQAARQAIHELCKYAALVKEQYGWASHSIRSILVSTEWSELLVPFSEYARIADHPVHGYQLEVSSSGKVAKATPVRPVPTSQEREICPNHMVYLFAFAEMRDRAMSQIASAISSVGIKDFCILKMDRRAKIIPYPYASYAAMDVVVPSDRFGLAERFLVDLEAEEFKENQWFLEECAWAAINSKIDCDSMEIGYPEKLSPLLQTWSVKGFHRFGRFSDAEVMPDETMLQQLTGLSGNHSAAFRSVASPRFQQAWDKTLLSAQLCMTSSTALKSIFDWYTLRGVSTEATFAIQIFNPANIMASLYAFATRADPDYFPSLEIVVMDGNHVRVLEGFIVWDGTTFPREPSEIAGTIDRSSWNFFFLWSNGGLAEYDSRIMRAHGLAFVFVETTLSPGEEPVRRWVRKAKGAWKIASEVHPSEILTVVDFVVHNPAYLEKLARFVRSNVIEIP